jgi:membrane fusion protein (multidrug efflux system)
LNRSQLQTRIIPAILIAALLAAVLWGSVRSGHLPASRTVPRSPVSVTAAPVSVINKAEEIVLPGSVQSREATVISAPISGRVSEVNVTEGQTAKAGQALVHIEGVVAAADETAAAAAAQNEAGNRQAQANYDKLVQEYDRYQKLYQIGAIARRQLEDTAARLQAAKTALAGIPDPGSGSSTSPRQPGFATLIAPSEGKVTGLSAAVDKTVQAGQQLLVLDNGGDMRIVVHLAQKDLYLVHAGSPAEIAVSGSTQISTGQVEAIYPEIGSTNNLFLTHIRADNLSGLLQPDATVNVHLKTGQTVTAPAVPITAVLKDQDGTYLYLAVNGQAIRQQVAVGVASGDQVEITSPLPEQALVITSGVSSLRDGDAIILQ